MSYGSAVLPEKYLDLKTSIAKTLDQKHIEKVWGEVLDHLKQVTKENETVGPNIVPQVSFEDIDTISQERIDEIKRRGVVVIKDVVPDDLALQWKEWLKEYVTQNVVDGFPVDDPQFYMLYWGKGQVQARAHPNVLRAQKFLNSLYHSSAGNLEGYDPSLPLTYADRFRIRRAGFFWDDHKPHIDGGGIERWEDLKFRECFKDILYGDWSTHDPYDLSQRIEARSSLYGRPNQSTVLRTFQGWLSLSSTAPGEGTLKIFPSVHVTNAYLILRPFFRLKKDYTGDKLDKENWEYDVSTSEFPGIWWREEENISDGPRLTDEYHPHLKLGTSMVSVPKVEPGDMVFWHCDLIHSVEPEHNGSGDSSVIYIPSVPTTPFNKEYITRQFEHFLKGLAPPDFPVDSRPETGFVGIGTLDDVTKGEGRRAMGVVVM